MTRDLRYGLPFIPDRKLFRAVMFALRLIEDQVAIGVAIRMSADFHKVGTAEVSRYIRIAAAYEGRMTR